MYGKTKGGCDCGWVGPAVLDQLGYVMSPVHRSRRLANGQRCQHAPNVDVFVEGHSEMPWWPYGLRI